MARHWRDVGGAYANALAAVQGDTDSIISELANLWRAPELTADEAMLRASAVRAQLEPILESERQWLHQLRRQLEQAKEETKTLAVEVGEPIPVDFGKQSILEQISTLQNDRARFQELREVQKQELQELMAKIERECKRLVVDPSNYPVDRNVTGIASLRAANQQLRQLDILEKERLGSIARLRSKVAELAGMLGEALEFRLAYDGEFTGCDDGVVVLPSSEDNRRFVADVAEFKHAGPMDAVAFDRCHASLTRIVEEYSRELEKKQARARSRSRSCSASYSYSRSRSRSGRGTRHHKAARGQSGQPPAQGTGSWAPPPPPGAGWRPIGQQPPSGYGATSPAAPPVHVGYGPPPGPAYGHPPPGQPPPGHDQQPGYWPPPSHPGYDGSRPPHGGPPPPHLGFEAGHPPPQLAGAHPPPPHTGYDGHPPPGSHPPPQHPGYDAGHPPPQHPGHDPGYPPPQHPPPQHPGYDTGHPPPQHPPPQHPPPQIGYDGHPPPPHAGHGYDGHPPPPAYGSGPPPGYGAPPPGYASGHPPPHAGHYGASPPGYENSGHPPAGIHGSAQSPPPSGYYGAAPPPAHSGHYGPVPDFSGGQPPAAPGYGQYQVPAQPVYGDGAMPPYGR